MAKKNDKSLVFAISFAAAAIAGSVVFMGTQMGGASVSDNDMQAQMFAAIDQYIENQETDAREAAEEAARKAALGAEDDDAVLGDADAPVTIIEFSDFQCSFCRSFYNGAYQEIKDEYVSKGLVKFVYRDFPLSFHRDAQDAAFAAECARAQDGDEAYFAMHDKIFEGQGPSSDGTVAIPDSALKQYAVDLQLDLDEFLRCIDDEDFLTEVQADTADGEALGVTGTPGFLINGQGFGGAQPFDEFQKVIEAELAKVQ